MSCEQDVIGEGSDILPVPLINTSLFFFAFPTVTLSFYASLLLSLSLFLILFHVRCLHFTSISSSLYSLLVYLFQCRLPLTVLSALYIFNPYFSLHVDKKESLKRERKVLTILKMYSQGHRFFFFQIIHSAIHSRVNLSSSQHSSKNGLYEEFGSFYRRLP